MIPKINLIVEGATEVSKKIGDIKDRALDWRPISEEIHDLLIDRMDQNFQTEGRSEGNPWAGYSQEPKYAAYKRAITGHNQILRWQKNGKYEELYPSLTQKGHGSHVWKWNSPRSVKYGTTARNAASVQRAGIGPFGERSPERDFIGQGRTTRRMVVGSLITNWIIRGKTE